MDDLPDDRGGAGQFEDHDRLVRSRIGNDKQRFARQETPRAGITILVPDEIDWALANRFPISHLDGVACLVDDDH